jgi:RNA polymerase sigma factor (sigma-70 family)
VRRIRAWRVPPRWSPADWWEEAEAQGIAAAWRAMCDYDPSRGVPLEAFLHQRILFGIRTRYRQEWAYALHLGTEDTTESIAAVPDHSPTLDECLNHLRADHPPLGDLDRRLIERLFWEGWTEAEAARELGVSQSAISRRKSKLIRYLHKSIL